MYIHALTQAYVHMYILVYIHKYIHICTYAIHIDFCMKNNYDTVCFVNPGHTETKMFINNNIMNKIHKSLILIKHFTPFVITVTQ